MTAQSGVAVLQDETKIGSRSSRRRMEPRFSSPLSLRQSSADDNPCYTRLRQRRLRTRSWGSAFHFMVLLSMIVARSERVVSAFHGTNRIPRDSITVLHPQTTPFFCSPARQLTRPSPVTRLYDSERTEAEVKLLTHLNTSNGEAVKKASSADADAGQKTGDAPLPTPNGGFTHTAASKAKISASNKGRTPWNKGRQRSPEVKARIAAGVRARNRAAFLQKLDEMGLTEEEYELQKKEERRRKEAERRNRKTEKGGYRPTEETKQKISEVLKTKWANGEISKRRTDPSKVRRGFTHSEETRAKISASLRKRWATDEGYRENMVNKSSQHNGHVDVRRRISEALKAKWQEPEFRERMLEQIRNRRSASGERGEEYRRKISEAMKTKWREQEYREKTLGSIRERAKELAKTRPLKPPTVGQRNERKTENESSVHLTKVTTPREPRRPKQVDESGNSIRSTASDNGALKKETKKKKITKKSSQSASASEVGEISKKKKKKKKIVKKKKKSASEEMALKEPDGSITRLRDERRDLYDLLYGDEDPAPSRAKSGLAFMLDLQDENLDTFDPYGLEDF